VEQLCYHAFYDTDCKTESNTQVYSKPIHTYLLANSKQFQDFLFIYSD